ncbi:UvrD-helicase domain-containing protein [Corallococcus exiguus]|uniref:UvrD-helicase domain-containing protein n=1 Tax=Corallococcus exiguus TaxID=83462 RepID=UPI001471ACD3|nr:UvrD-helicase domain-containing protein [Corallococcus exiguus]NNC14835.1 UvrD-helicase domain-containing protein [Corallococcus exiguus]
MADVEVTVYRRGVPVCTVMRPLRQLDDNPAVKYKGRLYTLVGGNAIHLDDAPVNAAKAPLDTKAPAPKVPRAAKATGDATVGQTSPRKAAPEPLQRAVIEAPSDARLLVDAGPGTGKTAVACERVAWLLQQHGLQPTRIWLISFTRTAVREIRDRITRIVKDPEAAQAVQIATLDAHAWAIHSGFDTLAKIAASYEKNIEDVLKLVEQNQELAEYLERVEHLVVDEAQDVVGIRASLVATLISRLPESCGVTVFADEAQAIYGFADDAEAKAGRKREPPLTERLRESKPGFEIRPLQQVFRTDSQNLLSLFTNTRAKVLAPALDSAARLVDVKKEIVELSHGEVPGVHQQPLEQAEDVLVLFRRRSEVLMASSYLNAKGVQHRIRMSGMPPCLPVWIGACLGEHLAPSLTRTDFLSLWKQRVGGTPSETALPASAWELLWRYAGKLENVVDMRRLRAVLGRAQPPADFCTSELGAHGPIIGTIHASKGREARTVHLMLPQGKPGKDTDFDAEARVVFVGATRAKAQLMVGTGPRHYAMTLESTRCYSPVQNDPGCAQIELGRDGDVSVVSMAGRGPYRSAEEVRAVQSRLLKMARFPLKAKARLCRGPDSDYTYMLQTDKEGELLGALSSSLDSELFEVARCISGKTDKARRKPPDRIFNLHVVGVRTAVLPPDSSEAERLHAPWAMSGIVLVPVILGYTKTLFPKY